MADTLLQVATDELQNARDEQARVAAELATAQQDLQDAQTGLDAAVSDLKQLNDEAASIRRQIAQTTVSADGQQLFADLDANRTAARAKQAAIVSLQGELADARSRIAAGRDEAAAAAAEVRALTAMEQAATDQQTANTNAVNAATSAPLSGIPAASDVTAAGEAKDAQTAARARLDEDNGGDLPKELFARAEERWVTELSRIAAVGKQAIDAADRRATEGAKAGLSGTTAQQRLAFGRSETALRDFALTAAARHDHALALLAGVSSSDGLSNAETDRLKALRDAAVSEDSFSLEHALGAAREAVADKQDEIAAARLDALAKDPTADPDEDATVKALIDELPPLEQAVTDAENAFTDDARKALDAIEAAVPDTMWALFSDYEQALVLFDDLKAVDPGTLKSTFQSAEDAYAQALRAEKDNARTVLAVGELERGLSDRVDTFAQTRSSRLLQALRGDD
jgi:hypothetical protein